MYGNSHMVHLPELIKFPPTQSYLQTCTALHMLDIEHQRGAPSRARQKSFVLPPIMGNLAANVDYFDTTRLTTLPFNDFQSKLSSHAPWTTWSTNNIFRNRQVTKHARPGLSLTNQELDQKFGNWYKYNPTRP